MSNSTPVSVIMIVKNAETSIARALSSVAWANEIILVDAESTDRTRMISEAPEAAWAGRLQFITRNWTGFRDQRNFALQKAKHKWIFSIDADEACSAELRDWITKFLTSPDADRPAYFKVRRQEYFLGKPVHYGVWNPSYQDRFFHREGVQYVNEIHEYPKYPSTTGRIEDPIDHWPDFHIEAFLDKLNRYTTIEAQDRYRVGQRTNLIHLVGAGPAMFLKNYFYYSAYKDGMHGLIISVLEGISRAVRHVKLWQLGQRDLNARSKP